MDARDTQYTIGVDVVAEMLDLMQICIIILNRKVYYKSYSSCGDNTLYATKTNCQSSRESKRYRRTIMHEIR
jgi:hypothetical protein